MSMDSDETLASSPARGRGGSGGATGMDQIQAGVVIADRWKIVSYLAEGGMGILYLAADQQAHERQVVVKFPKRHLCHQEGFLERFDREIASLIAFEHPHVVRVYGAGRFDNLPYVVLQYLPRGSLADWIKQKPLSVNDLGWLSRVASALDSLHKQGIVHRDIKAANILFDKHGEPYLSDFGIVKIFTELRSGDSTQGLIGSPESFAPEFGAPNPYTPAYDQYGLALAVYRALSGRIPYDATTTGGLLVQIITEIPPPLHEAAPHISPAVSQVVMKGLSKKPEDRYPSCVEFARAMEDALRAEHPRTELIPMTDKSSGGKNTWLTPISRVLATRTRRHRAIYTGAICIGLAAIAVAAGWLEPQAFQDDIQRTVSSGPTANASLAADQRSETSRSEPTTAEAERTVVRTTGRGDSIPAAVDQAIERALTEVYGKILPAGAMGYRTVLASADRTGADRTAGRDLDVASAAFAERVAASTRGAVSNFRVLSVTPAQATGLFDVAIEASVAKAVSPAGSDRLRIVVAPLELASPTVMVNQTRIEAAVIEQRLRRQLTETLARNRRIAVLDREFTAQANAEIDLLASGNAGNDAMARLGTLLAADYLLVGRIEQFGYERRERRLRTNERTLVSLAGGGKLTLRLIHFASREIEQVQTVSITLPETAPTTLGTSVDVERVTADLTRDLSDQAARKILGRLVPITVVAIQNGEIILNQGGLTPGQQYAVVLRGAEIKDPQTGKSLGRTETPCCTIRVSRATETLSYARAVFQDIDVAQAFASGTLELRDPVDAPRSTAPPARAPATTPPSALAPFEPLPEEQETEW